MGLAVQKQKKKRMGQKKQIDRVEHEKHNAYEKRDRWVKKREAEEASSWPPSIFLPEAIEQSVEN